MQFQNVIGQQEAKQQLLGMWQSNHLPHALLIAGQEGTGTLPMALSLAQFIFCEAKTETDACGKCPNCGKTAKLEHADLHLSFPTIKVDGVKEVVSGNFLKPFRKFCAEQPYGSVFDWLQYINAENKQGNISAEECQIIIEKLNLKSYEGGSKVMIIWEPEYLGKAGNILLKLIEEPPANTIIILVASSIDNVLPTIISRVQTIKLPPTKKADIEQSLLQYYEITAERAQQIAMMCEGNYNQAQHLVSHIENDLFPLTRQWFNILFTNNGIESIKFSEDVAKMGREIQKSLLTYIIHLLQATLKQRYTGRCHLANEELAFVQKLANTSLSFEALSQMINLLSDTVYLIQRNANSKMQLQALSIKMMRTIQNKKVSSLV